MSKEKMIRGLQLTRGVDWGLRGRFFAWKRKEKERKMGKYMVKKEKYMVKNEEVRDYLPTYS